MLLFPKLHTGEKDSFVIFSNSNEIFCWRKW